MKFSIECDMNPRWVPVFLAMLKRMEYLGVVGSSRKVAIFADGDGDFRPKFKYDSSLPDKAKPVKTDGENFLYDAG